MLAGAHGAGARPAAHRSLVTGQPPTSRWPVAGSQFYAVRVARDAGWQVGIVRFRCRLDTARGGAPAGTVTTGLDLVDLVAGSITCKPSGARLMEGEVKVKTSGDFF